MAKSYVFTEGETAVFTEEEVIALKAIAQQHIRFTDIFTKDKDGKQYPYRNRYSIDSPNLPSEKEKKC